MHQLEGEPSTAWCNNATEERVLRKNYAKVSDAAEVSSEVKSKGLQLRRSLVWAEARPH